MAEVSLLDVDLCHQSIPYLLKLEDKEDHQCPEGWVPVYTDEDQKLDVMSPGYLHKSRNDGVVWRGPKTLENNHAAEEIEFINVNQSVVFKEEVFSDDFDIDGTTIFTYYGNETKPIYCSICRVVEETDEIRDAGNSKEKFKLCCDNCYENDFQKYIVSWQEKIDSSFKKCDCSTDVLKNDISEKNQAWYSFLWCRKCDVIIDQEKYVLLHCKICDGQRRSVICYNCSEFCNNVVASRKLYSCCYCFKYFSSKCNLSAHKKAIHSKFKPHSCDYCKKSFIYSYLLKDHLQIHSDEKLYSCEICFKSFSRKISLRGHLKSHSKRKPYFCNICSSYFSSQGYLKKHFLVHLGIKPFSCDICSRSFAHKENLRTHLYIHTGEKPHSCKICSKSFTTPRSLRNHLGTHSDKKLYSCNTCSKYFSSLDAHKNHLKNHTAEKRFSCNICPNTYARLYSLNYHLKVHSGDRPFSCEICNKTFVTSYDLSYHMKTHSGKDLYSCEICYKSFPRKSSLNRHLKTHSN